MFRGSIVEVEDFLPQRAVRRARTAGAFFVFNRNPEALAERLHGFGEIQLLRFTDERDDVAALPAAEAVVVALVGIDIERRSFLVVKRAQSLEARPARLAQGHHARNDVSEMDSQLQVADAGGFDDGHGAENGGAGERCPPALDAK